MVFSLEDQRDTVHHLPLATPSPDWNYLERVDSSLGIVCVPGVSSGYKDKHIPEHHKHT